MAFIFPLTIDKIVSRWKADGHRVWLQVHRDLCWHQPQRGRAPGGYPDTNPAQAGRAAGGAAVLHKEALAVTHGRRPGLSEVPGTADIRQSQGEGASEQGLGAGLQVQELRELARPLDSSLTSTRQKKL